MKMFNLFDRKVISLDSAFYKEYMRANMLFPQAHLGIVICGLTELLNRSNFSVDFFNRKLNKEHFRKMIKSANAVHEAKGIPRRINMEDVTSLGGGINHYMMTAFYIVLLLIRVKNSKSSEALMTRKRRITVADVSALNLSDQEMKEVTTFFNLCRTILASNEIMSLVKARLKTFDTKLEVEAPKPSVISGVLTKRGRALNAVRKKIIEEKKRKEKR